MVFRFTDGVFHLFNCVLAQVTSLAKHLVKRWLDYWCGIGVPDNEIRRLQLLAIREKEENSKRRRKLNSKVSWKEINNVLFKPPIEIKQDTPSRRCNMGVQAYY